MYVHNNTDQTNQQGQGTSCKSIQIFKIVKINKTTQK